MARYVGKISHLSNETIYNSLGISDFYSRYPRITKAGVLKVISVLKHKLSYNNSTGTTKIDNEFVAKYSNKSDIQKYTSHDQLIRWEFSAVILNAVQLVHNGYPMY